MPCHPLFSDHTISLSATLAATIGLEEAVLLTILNDAARIQTQPQARLSNEALRQQLPFWDDVTIRRMLNGLIDKGLLRLQGPMFPDASGIIFIFDGAEQTAQPNVVKPSVSQRATTPRAPSVQMPGAQVPVRVPVDQAAISNTSATRQDTRQDTPTPARPAPMPAQWQPAEDTLRRLEQHKISRAFSFAQMDTFVLQGLEQGTNRNDWNTRFFRHVKSQWVFTQNDANKFQRMHERTGFNPMQDEAKPIGSEWQPSSDALQILQRAGIDPQFIEDAVPEFILYWSERGDVFKTWNSKFIQHVRQQWARYTAAVEHSPLPTRIENDWQPAEDCFDILGMGHISEEFARSLVAEFVLYWRDSNQVHNSWNSRFLQYVKQQWGKRLAGQMSGEKNGQQTTAQPGYTTAEASVSRLSDTSWAK